MAYLTAARLARLEQRAARMRQASEPPPRVRVTWDDDPPEPLAPGDVLIRIQWPDDAEERPCD